MSCDLSENGNGFNDLRKHIGHSVVVVGYGDSNVVKELVNVAMECEDCSEVLMSFDNPKFDIPNGITLQEYDIEGLKVNIIAQLRKQIKECPPQSVSLAQHEMTILHIGEAKNIEDIKLRLHEFGCSSSETETFIKDMEK